MREISGNIWDYLGRGTIAITTNGYVTEQGIAVFGEGVARQARGLYPDLPAILGRLIREHGNHVAPLGRGLVSFPVEVSPWALPDLSLIRRSARELAGMADREGWQLVVVPRPGCGGGGLLWSEVLPCLDDLFDERFLIVTRSD